MRSLTCGCYRGMLDSAILVQCRADAEAGLYAQAMAAFIHWQAAQRDQVLAQLAGETRTIRQTLEMDGHPKTPGILADLAAGWQAFLRFAVERAGIPQTEAAELGARMNGALRELGAEQAQALVAAEPAGRSITLLRAAVAGARAHLTHLDTNRRPPNALQHGWRVHTSHSEDDEGRSSTRTEVRAEGDHLGYVDGQGEIYLEPAIAYKMAVRLANDEGDTLGVGFITWKKRLHEQKFLAEIRRDRGQLHLDVRKTVGGKRRPVLHIRAIAWNPSDEPEPPPADETPPSDEEPADASPGKPPPGPDKDSPVGGLCTGINSRANRAKNDDSPDLSTSGAWPCNDPVALERGPEDDFRATQEPLKNNADRANWPSWPSKITQYTSPLAENVEEAPKPAAWRGAGPFMAGAAVAGFRVVIARGQPVLEGRGDTQEEQALIRDLRAHQAELQAMLGRPPCHACKGLEWWVSTAGGVFCRRCKPPILDRLVAMRFKTEQEGAEDRHGRGET